MPQKWRGTRQLLATFALGPDSHIDADWTTCESELLTKPPLDEATVVCLEESGRKQHECGWRHACLRAQEDARLLTSVDTLPMTGGQGVAGSNPVSPTPCLLWSEAVSPSLGERPSGCLACATNSVSHRIWRIAFLGNGTRVGLASCTPAARRPTRNSLGSGLTCRGLSVAAKRRLEATVAIEFLATIPTLEPEQNRVERKRKNDPHSVGNYGVGQDFVVLRKQVSGVVRRVKFRGEEIEPRPSLDPGDDDLKGHTKRPNDREFSPVPVSEARAFPSSEKEPSQCHTHHPDTGIFDRVRQVYVPVRKRIVIQQYGGYLPRVGVFPVVIPL